VGIWDWAIFKDTDGDAQSEAAEGGDGEAK